MAIESGRRIGTSLTERMLAPVSWTQQGVARLLGWFNQERWTNLLTILGLVLGNLAILLFLVQGQDNRAIAFVILTLIAPLAFLIPELSIVAFISAGAGLFVNAMYFAAGPGGGTGERTLILTFLGILSARALYEYVRTPASQRPRLLSWFTIIFLLFWTYYMTHVLIIYLFHYNAPSTDPLEAVFGFDTRGIFRYFDYHMIWVGIFPLIILLRDYRRARRVLMLLAIVVGIGILGIVWDYISPLPDFFKILLQLRAAGETEEGYRIRDPASLYLILVGFFAALYALGYARGIRNIPLMVYIALSLFVVLITKNRALWMGMMVFAPFALLWKPPSVLLRQAWLFGAAVIVLLALMLHPRLNELASNAVAEALQRWSRNYAYGGDPRLDPSYQGRVREYEAFTFHWERLTPLERLFGMGLEARYKHYTSLADLGYQGPRFKRLYFEKVYMHFSWVARMHHIGYVGITLLWLTLVGFLLRAAVVFLRTQDIVCRALLVGVAGSTIGLLAFDVLHQTLRTSTAIPVIMLWSLAEVIPHWQRSGQLPTMPEMHSDEV
jgi:hypothetical protein